MKFIRMFSIVLSAFLLGAHFRWHGMDILSIPAVLFPVLLFVRRAWAARTVQIILFLGGLEWVRTTIEIASRRMDAGEPWVRMAVILGAVAVFTAVSALPFSRNRSLRVKYGLEKNVPAPEVVS
ncbi:MAG: hypothetical protein KAH54_08905 [Candidatus Sabulitectum sp.]|nr:hypothetical protein [Candidatus Sabulitectum sp.]